MIGNFFYGKSFPNLNKIPERSRNRGNAREAERPTDQSHTKGDKMEGAFHYVNQINVLIYKMGSVVFRIIAKGLY